jgi:hypothetical protein
VFVERKGEAPLVLRVSDQEVLLGIQRIKPIVSVAWTLDGKRWILSDDKNQLHVWENIDTMSVPKDERLEDYANRQEPDFGLRLSSLAGPIVATPEGRLVVANAEGLLLEVPVGAGSAMSLGKLGQPVESLVLGDNHVVALAEGKSMVARKAPWAWLKWSVPMKIEAAAAGLQDAERLVLLRGEDVAALKWETGEQAWSHPRPASDFCGLAMEPRGARVAACFGGVVSIFKGDTGAPEAWVWRGSQGLKAERAP